MNEQINPNNSSSIFSNNTSTNFNGAYQGLNVANNNHQLNPQFQIPQSNKNEINILVGIERNQQRIINNPQNPITQQIPSINQTIPNQIQTPLSSPYPDYGAPIIQSQNPQDVYRFRIEGEKKCCCNLCDNCFCCCYKFKIS